MPNELKGYDAFQVLRSVFDVNKNCLRVCIVDPVTGGPGGDIEVAIVHTEDSVRLGNGTNFLTSTTIGGDIGLDVNIINTVLDVQAVDFDIRDLDASQDNIAISDGTNTLEITGKKEARTVDTLHCGGINKIITVTDTPVKIEKVAASPKSDRKTIFATPLAKGVFWAFEATVTADETPTGGSPLGKNQPLVIDAESNTPVYLVGPSSGIKVFIAEA